MTTAHPAALQLRLLETVVEVAAEKNSTLVLPFPVELLRFLERATPTEAATRPAASTDAARTPTQNASESAPPTSGTPTDGVREDERTPLARIPATTDGAVTVAHGAAQR